MLFLNYSLEKPLLLLLLIPFLIVVIFLYFKGNNIKTFSAFDDLQKVFKSNAVYYKLYYIFTFLCCVFFVLILSGPRSISEEKEVSKNGVDIEIVLDVSYSMLARDLKPSRLDVAKNVINNFLEEEVSDRVGIIVFSGKPFTSLPLSFNYEIIKNVLSRITIDTINKNKQELQGTAIGDALVLATDNLFSSNKEGDELREKVLILLTDGTSNRGVDPHIAIKLLKEKNIKTYVVGIGGEESTFITLQDSFGFPVKLDIEGLDESLLKKIAEETGGKYYRANSESKFEEILSEISRLEKKEIAVESYEVKEEKNSLFIYILIFLFLTIIFIKFRKKI